MFNKVHSDGSTKSNELQNIKTKMMEKIEKIKVLNESHSINKSSIAKSGNQSVNSIDSKEKLETKKAINIPK